MALEIHGSANTAFRDVDGKIQEALKDIPAAGYDDSYFDFFLEKYSYEEIEKMDLGTVAKVFPDCLHTDEVIDADTLASSKDAFIKGFQVLIDMDFTSLWEENCLPLLTKQCEDYNTLLAADPAAANIIADIRKIKNGINLGGSNVYLSYFLQANSAFHLACPLSPDNCFLTRLSNGSIGPSNIASFLQLFAHEMTHDFSTDGLQELYKNACETDEFLKKTKYVLFEKYNSESYEEEFVVALAHYISVKEGLITEDAGYDAVAYTYGGCEPIALIVFDALIKYGDIPDDTNAWLSGLFENGTIKAGEIESKVDSISDGFVQRFNDQWGSEIPE